MSNISSTGGGEGADGGAIYRCRALGLTVDADWPLPGAHREPGAPSDPRTYVWRASSAAVDEAWAPEGERIMEHRRPDGQIGFVVDRSREHYRFWLDGFGRYLIALDGETVACERDAAQRSQHERFVLAHGLPVAAVLHGYEVLHVSAIAVEAGTVAFAGPSGTGKTRLASRLVARGASFLTDDVLAVEAVGDAVIGHPGPPVMAIRPDDAAMLAEVGGRLGVEAGRSDKVHVSPPRRADKRPLRAIYHLEWGDTFQIEPLAGVGLQRLLSLSFIPYLATPERLKRHLAIAQLISAGVAQFRLQTTGAPPTDEMLTALERHVRNAGA